MADEINRASPRTQSALLQAMQEGRVSIAGQYHPLPRPFHVLATQNPLEQEGTYPLPEAQLDRFLLQIDVDYPDLEAERQMLIATTGIARGPAAAGDERRRADGGAAPGAPHPGRRERRRGDPVAGALRPAGRDGASTGSGASCRLGPGTARQPGADARLPRPGADRRPVRPSIDDVLALAPPVLRHRMAVSFAGRAEGVTVAQVIEQISAPLR